MLITSGLPTIRELGSVTGKSITYYLAMHREFACACRRAHQGLCPAIKNHPIRRS